MVLFILIGTLLLSAYYKSTGSLRISVFSSAQIVALLSPLTHWQNISIVLPLALPFPNQDTLKRAAPYMYRLFCLNTLWIYTTLKLLDTHVSNNRNTLTFQFFHAYNIRKRHHPIESVISRTSQQD